MYKQHKNQSHRDARELKTELEKEIELYKLQEKYGIKFNIPPNSLVTSYSLTWKVIKPKKTNGIARK